MANTKSAIKNARKTARRTERNKAARTRLKTLARKVATLEAAGKTEEARTAAIAYTSALDKASKTKVIHKNAASRRKARLSKLTGSAKATAAAPKPTADKAVAKA